MRWYNTRLEKRGVHLTGIYFDNREMAEMEKQDIRKVSSKLDAHLWGGGNFSGWWRIQAFGWESPPPSVPPPHGWGRKEKDKIGKLKEK